jgi:hypothetical protein
MTDTQFSIDPDDGFYLTIADELTIYKEYDAAVAEIQSKLQTDAEGFLAEVAIERTDDGEDVAVTLEQVGWQQIIRDMAATPPEGE